jgi:diaminopimelate decarboxylase
MGTSVLTDPFPYVEGVLHCGPHGLDELAERLGTPLYVYSIDHVEARYHAFVEAFHEADLLVAYSVKANGNLALLHRLGRLGAGADIVSRGELHRALRAGIPAERIVFAGVAKSVEEMEAGLDAGILAFNVESRGELERLESVARVRGEVAPFAVRVNPDVLSPTPHAYTRTGHAATKFGVPPEEAVALYGWASRHPHLRAVGVDVHIGSQISEAAPYTSALERTLEVLDALPERGRDLDFLDLGGGFAVAYGDAGPGIELEALARQVVPRVAGRGLRLVVEPGRALVGEAGVLLTRVQYLKTSGGRTFVIVDGGMTDLIRPSHYGGYHAVSHVAPRVGAPVAAVDIVGPICETGDFLALDRHMPLPQPGDLLAVRTVGAYGFTMASNYNARRRPAEVVVEGDRIHVVRARENLDDLVRGETIPWQEEGA